MAFFFLVASGFLVLGCCAPSRNSAPEAPGTSSSSATFEDELSLTGYSVQNKDGYTEIDLRWKAERKLSVDYVAFVHAVDEAGTVVFQLDPAFKNGFGSPTSLWAAGDVATDRFFAIPSPAPSSVVYTFRLGLY